MTITRVSLTRRYGTTQVAIVRGKRGHRYLASPTSLHRLAKALRYCNERLQWHVTKWDCTVFTEFDFWAS